MALKYRINILGWYNFEGLVQTLLKVLIGSGVKSIGGTKDGGRDASFEGEAPFPSKRTKWKGKWIFQVKYSELETGSVEAIGKRILNAFNKEIKNIEQRRGYWPNNYILITNVHLTSTLRNKLSDVIRVAGFNGNFQSIDGREICEFLDIYPHIRYSFPQLIGLADLNKIINKELYNRSEAFVADLQPKLSVFVTTNQYFKAHEILRKYHFVVLDGPPESGKSFIGAAITLSYTAEGYEVFYPQKPAEIYKVHNFSNKQVYFADDAVGSITFDPNLGDFWGRDLPGIIHKLDKHHKLIWTARKYILQEALDRTKLGEHIDNFPGIHEVLVEVSDYKLLEKGLILYNHAKQANLTGDAKKLIKENANFISNHSNYTPERIRQLIQLILSGVQKKLSLKEKQEWCKKIDEFLKNPSERFCKAYREALGHSERTMLITLLDLGKRVEINKLKEEYERRISIV